VGSGTVLAHWHVRVGLSPGHACVPSHRERCALRSDRWRRAGAAAARVCTGVVSDWQPRAAGRDGWVGGTCVVVFCNFAGQTMSDGQLWAVAAWLE
jgi:hypothetical protein